MKLKIKKIENVRLTMCIEDGGSTGGGCES